MTSPLTRLTHDFAALFGGELHSGRLIQPATSNAHDTRGLSLGDADRMSSDEQQDDNGS